jgi:hypothetical protein
MGRRKPIGARDRFMFSFRKIQSEIMKLPRGKISETELHHPRPDTKGIDAIWLNQSMVSTLSVA